MDHQQGSPIWHMELCSMLCGSLDGRGVWGRMDACVWMTGSLCCSPETIAILFVNRLYSNTKLRAFKKINSVFSQAPILLFSMYPLLNIKLSFYIFYLCKIIPITYIYNFILKARSLCVLFWIFFTSLYFMNTFSSQYSEI